MNDIKSIVFDEIALEGLDGITIESLWIRLKDSNFKLLNLDDLNSRIYIWKNVVLKFANNNFKFYLLPEEREPIQIFNRYDQVSQETGYCIYNEDQIPDSCRVDIFPINTPEERGSCKFYKERKLIDLNKISDDLNLVMEEYGHKLVIVANQILRENSLRINYSDPHVDLSTTQYCLMERIGYCRKYGELTFGKESANFKEPPKTLFYFRKLLLKKGLITKQTHTIYNSRTLSISRGLLLMLPRFHIERKTYIEKGAIRIIEILKTKPNYKSNYLDLRAETKMRNKPFKQIFAEYHKNFRLTEESVKSNNKTIKTKFVQLIKSFDDESDSDEEDDLDSDLSTTIRPNSNKIEMFSPESIVVNSPLLAQSRNVVDLFSTSNGISLREFQQQLVVPRLDARMLVRMLERLDEIETISTMNGRQKISKYFLKNNVNNQVTAFNDENNQLDLGGKATLIQLKRANLILNAVKEHKIIDQLIYFKKLILESEKNLPYSVDQKSIKRILGMLAKEKKLNWFKCTIDKDNLARKINLITIPAITEEDDIVKERFEQAKFKYGSFLSIDNEQQNLHQELTDHSWVLNLNSHKNDETELIYQPSIGRKYGLEPKMKKIITFYQFIFFTLSDQCKKDNDFNDWRKHITPLPKSYEKDTCLLGDLIPRIPLCIFAKVVFITFIIPGLQEILNDPIKCNYTLQMLPPDIVKNLFRKRKYIFDMVELLTLLTYLNLVKIESRHLSMKESVSIKLFKTTQFIEDGYIKSYRFDCLNDIELFSNDLALHGSRTDCKNCTFDSRLYIHNPRNWSYLPKIQRNQIKDIRRFARLRKNVIGDSVDQSNNTKTTTRKRKSTISRPTKRAKKAQTANNTNKSTTKATEKDEISISNRKKGYDNDDINALSLLRKQRCEWSKEEDSFLLMCRVASMLLNPNSINFVCVHKKVLRDQLHLYLPNLSLDKTSKACQRRLMYMLKNPTTRAHVLDWVAECKQDLELISIKKPNVPLSHEAEWNKQFINLLQTLLKKFQNEHFVRPLASLEKFRTLDDIYKNYDLVESEIHCVPQKPILYFQPNNIVDIYVNVVLNVLSSSLLTNLYENSDEYNTKSTLALFKIYQRYPDTMIRAVVNKMKQNGMMAKLRGSRNKNKIQKTNDKNGKKLALFKISQHYCYMLRSKFSMDSLVKPIALECDYQIEEFIPTHLAFITNLLNMNRIKFTINLPDNFVSFKDNFNTSATINNNKTSSIATINNDRASVSSYPSDVIEHFNLNKRISRFVLCSLRQKLDNNLNEKVQTQPDYLNLNGCQINCQISDVNNLIDLTSFLELLNKQEKFIELDNDIEENVELDSLEKLVIREVMKFKDIGINYNHLAENLKLKNVDDNNNESFKEKINKLCDKELLFEVGVEEVRYVTYKYVSSWLVYIQIPSDERIRGNTRQSASVENISNNLEINCNSYKSIENETMEVNQENLSNQSTEQLATINQSSSQTIESTNSNESNQNIVNENTLSIATTTSSAATILNQSNLSSTSEQFVKPSSIYFMPKFWKTPFGKLDKRIILMFLIGVLGHIMTYPGIKHEELISYFKFCLPPLQTIEIIELLIAGNCIKKEEKIIEYKYTLFDEPEKRLLIYYEPTKQSFINVCLIKNKLEQ